MANNLLTAGEVVFLNIGLGHALKPANEVQGGKALRLWAPVLRDVFVRYRAEFVVPADDGETKLVVAGRVAEPVTTALNDAILASGQDCIAVWFAEHGRGELWGPRADLWGGFDPKLFVVPSWIHTKEPAL